VDISEYSGHLRAANVTGAAGEGKGLAVQQHCLSLMPLSWYNIIKELPAGTCRTPSRDRQHSCRRQAKRHFAALK
jgi:hypothetical protein